MTIIVLTWIVLTELEAIRNWYLIVQKKKSPKHKMAWLLRIGVGIIFWILTPIVYKDLPYDSWWAMPVMMAFSFWFIFDVSLNLMRKRKIWYVGDPADPEEDSWLDDIQHSAFGGIPWLWAKFLLAGASITTFYYGWNFVLGIN